MCRRLPFVVGVLIVKGNMDMKQSRYQPVLLFVAVVHLGFDAMRYPRG